LSLDSGYRARSFLEFDRDKERSIEFHSFSKSYSMQGWRVGFAAGNRDAIAHVVKIKSNMDFGVFMAIQRAALAVLSGHQDYCAQASSLYRARRDAFLSAVKPLGWTVEPPRAALYVWLPVPSRYATSMDFAQDLLEKTGVVVAPGSGFGRAGEHYVRVALCVDEARLTEAGERMGKSGFRF
jgi:LL-diaminopimelate aminotransferase